ncbi:zinc finger protein 62-like [Leguminivora glycinivorella]|uniref:zinc finger protein 62-like n=1 Tax=Leguminivora glycinivorella TaxID=1035111 RepID=UPI00200E7278|nr:zinc finger protein 62-like [Leguminivora glycinivorella]
MIGEEERLHQCGECGLMLSTRSALTAHARSHRAVADAHRCDVCQKTFAVPARLQRHYRTHTGERPFECEYCHKMFSVKENLQVHRRIHTKSDLIDAAYVVRLSNIPENFTAMLVFTPVRDPMRAHIATKLLFNLDNCCASAVTTNTTKLTSFTSVPSGVCSRANYASLPSNANIFSYTTFSTSNWFTLFPTSFFTSSSKTEAYSST